MLPVAAQLDADLTTCFAQSITGLLDCFSEKDPASKQSLQQMLSSDSESFGKAAIQVLARESTGAAGARYVLHLLRKYNLLIEALADPRGCRREDAMAAARMIPRISAPLDSDLERALSSALSEPASVARASRILRLLDVLEAASPQPRLYLFQNELLAYPDSAVRSKAALLIARSSKSVALVGRLLLDTDGRVQANAVEALWTYDAADARPLLQHAARLKTPRVAGNAAVGLYRIGDLSSLQLMFRMAEEPDQDRRTTAAWAMGETGDPRFLPFLTAWYPRSSGNERVNVLQALGRIRRREKVLAEAGTIEIRVWTATVEGSRRHIVVTLWSREKADLNAVKPTQFAIREGGTLAQDYEVVAQPNPAMLISGFVVPRFSSAVDPYRTAMLDGIDRCLIHKRSEDLWRVDRYLIEPRAAGEPAPIPKAGLPFEESILGHFAKTQQRGFLAAPEALQTIVHSPGPKERAANGVVAAIHRQSEAIIKFPGKRKLFLFLYPDCARNLERHIAKLRYFISDERITLHGIVPKGASGCEEFQGLCLASEGGTFAVLPPEHIAEEVERIYAQSVNRFELSYQGPQPANPEGATIQIASEAGCGQVSFPFTNI
jgi:hypothetical protein